MTKQCKCGCGQQIIVKKYHKWYGIPNYLRGHNPSPSRFVKGHISWIKGKKQTSEHIVKRVIANHLTMQRRLIPIRWNHNEESKEKIKKASIERNAGLILKLVGKKTRFRRGNLPWNKNGKHTEETKKRMSYNLKEFYRNNPEKHPINIMRKRGFVSKPQKQLYESICNIFPKELVIMEHPVITSKTTRFIDVAVPHFKMGFECDGEYWHQDEEKDRLRDLELQAQGWEIKHIPANLLTFVNKH